MRTTQDVLDRVRAEYLDMPGMRLTIQQVQRLCGIEQMLCQTVLASLVDAKFLCVKSDGMYARSADDAVPRPAKADVRAGTRAAVAS